VMFDPTFHAQIDDWFTFYGGIKRSCHYFLHEKDQNALCLSILTNLIEG